MTKLVRFSLVLLLLVFAAFAVYPTFKWYFLVSQQEKDRAALTRIDIRDYAIAQAGDDIEALRELHVADSTQVIPEEFTYLEPMVQENYRLDQKAMPESLTVEDSLSSFYFEKDLLDKVTDHYFNPVTALKDMKSSIIELGLDLSGGVNVVLEANRASLVERLGREPSEEEFADAIDVALEILTSRIDVFGITEPEIRRLEDNRISIDIPGENDRDRVDSFLVGKGSLGLHIVDDDVTARLLEEQNNNPSWIYDPAEVPDYVPAGVQVYEYIVRDRFGVEQRLRWIAIKEDVSNFGLAGDFITEARVGQDPLTNRPTVNFLLNNDGADIFAKLTRDNVNSSLAIVMDNKVRAYATITQEIGDGQVLIRGFSAERARAIARILKTAALPVDFDVISQRVVGGTLSREAVSIGVRAIVLGLILVAGFILLYYRLSGLIANSMLVLNLFLMLAILSVFNLTLTLTSIAGIILTVGMAVDANVVIFERIKEEYRLGKGYAVSVRGGFKKAFWAIVDANITTFIAALFLSQFGSGPVQGFAITLAVGIVTSMFTALFVARLTFDFFIDVFGWSRPSIGWGIR